MNSKPEADITVGTPVTVHLHFTSGATRSLVAFPVRKGWHCAPPCNTTQPVYATPEDAAYAHDPPRVVGARRALAGRAARRERARHRRDAAGGAAPAQRDKGARDGSGEIGRGVVKNCGATGVEVAGDRTMTDVLAFFAALAIAVLASY